MTDFFSPDYFAARARFRSGVLANGGQIESILLDSKGPDGGDLTIDIGCFGSPEPKHIFIHSSGLHGVEGFAGSAIQLQWLEESGIGDLPSDGAIVVVHVMNPFGMAWLRRVNENNVDLNCNFLGADEPFAGAPGYYAVLDSFLNPASPPAADFFLLRAAGHALRHGMSVLRRTAFDGQYEFPRGLAYGGTRHEQAARRFQLYISGKLAGAEQVVAVDVHTGPGGKGSGKGSLGGLYSRMFPGARISFTVQEFGSCNAMTALAALRAENRQHHYGDGSVRNPAKATLLQAFCPSDKKWRDQVLARGRQVIVESLALALEPAVTRR